MTTTITTRREPRQSKKLTNAICETKVTAPDKIYDRECGGLLIAVSPTAPATFYLKYNCKVLKKRRTYRLGVYDAKIYNPMHARAAAMQLKVRADHGEDIQQAKRQARSEQAKLGVTVDRVIAERIAWMSTLVRKADGEMRPRIESWKGVDRIFHRFVKPRIGKMIASEVTARDIAQLSDDIVAGKLGQPSVANARHMRRAVSGLFRFAAQPSRGYITSSPCINLEPLDKEPPRSRVLSPAEIAVLWRGLDRADMHWDRRTCLALKFALTSMLRSTELLHAHRAELVDAGGKFPRIDVPMKRVKKRRVIHQPLSSLVVDLINEALTGADQAFVFAGRFKGTSLARNAMANALAGTWRIRNGKKVVKSIGICAMLGLEPFTPHDLRRTAASLMGSIGIPRSVVALCLDHAASDDQGGAVPRVTGVYDQDPRLQEKRAALEKLAMELRRIVGEPVQAKGVDAGMRLAA